MDKNRKNQTTKHKNAKEDLTTFSTKFSNKELYPYPSISTTPTA
jgi:hypothetical protein